MQKLNWIFFWLLRTHFFRKISCYLAFQPKDSANLSLISEVIIKQKVEGSQVVRHRKWILNQKPWTRPLKKKGLHIVLKYSGHAMWFRLILGQHLSQLSRLAWKHKNVNACPIQKNLDKTQSWYSTAVCLGFFESSVNNTLFFRGVMEGKFKII